jgi:hypothetical protein
MTLTLVRPVSAKNRCPECGEYTVGPAGEPCGFCKFKRHPSWVNVEEGPDAA